jgi:hypothetical protein
MVQFLLYTEYPSAFSALTASVNLSSAKIKKIICNQSNVVLLNISAKQVVAVPRKRLKIHESIQEFNLVLSSFEEQVNTEKSLAMNKALRFNFFSFFRRQQVPVFNPLTEEPLLQSGF